MKTIKLILRIFGLKAPMLSLNELLILKSALIEYEGNNPTDWSLVMPPLKKELGLYDLMAADLYRDWNHINKTIPRGIGHYNEMYQEMDMIAEEIEKLGYPDPLFTTFTLGIPDVKWQDKDFDCQRYYTYIHPLKD